MVNTLVDGVNLATDGINCIIQFLLGSLILPDYRLTLKRGIHTIIGSLVDVATQFLQFRNTTDDVLLGILFLNILVDFAPHFLEIGLVLVVLTFSNHIYV